MAIKKISANLLGNNAVTADKIADGAISAADIANNSITAAKLSTSTFAIDSLTVNTSDLVVDTANNRVGIGTSSPSVLLDVSGATPTIRAVGTSASNPSLTLSSAGITAWSQTVSGSDSSLSFNKDSSEKMRISSDGKVGIGTNSPTAGLTVSDSVAGTSDSRRITIQSTTNGVNAGYRFTTKSSNGTTRSAGYYFQPGDTTATSFLALSGDDTNTHLAITADGNVGIGTSSPNVNLEVSAGTCATQITSTTTSAGAIPSLVFNHAGNDAFGIVGGSYMAWKASNTTEVMRLTSSGNLGIGTSSPSQILHVKSASPNILLEGTNYPALKWAGTDLTADAEIYYGIGGNDLNINNYNSGIIAFKTNNTERMRILSSGGITFNGDTAGANALDDYEEGTWDPVLNLSTYGNIGRISSVYKGRYQKVGSVVHFQIYTRYDFSVVSAGNRTGSVTISLPFAQGGGTQQYNAVYISYLSDFLSSNVTNIGGYTLKGQSIVTIKNEDYSGGESDPTISGNSNAGIMVAGFYYTYDI